ncbi:site-specific tyrosine recombinase XerC [Microbulbifer variabilis]|uniref:site-specific tyrosine recombinase XerC n=1 Tax=Microbulbifer variabilis TaxID=266805 RepID=UPI000366F51E|nr:site-specific tyrosine recombinase XerC [Microbulbifer variabilis]
MDNKSLRFLSRLYLEHLQVMHYSPRTVGQQITALDQFANWCEERGISRANEVTKPILERYRRHLHHSRDRSGKPYSARNQAARLIPIRGFFKWATRQNYLLYNPASELELPKMERRLPKATLSAEEAETILAQPNTTTPEGLRDRTILEVLYSTGIRRMECVNLQKADLNASQGVLAVRQGKGKKDRFVQIGERAIEWLQHYLEDIRPGFVVEPDSQQIFIEANGLPLTPDRLSRLVSKYIKQADIGKTGSCHLFRHTVATLMLDNGADIRFIQQMLGHAHLQTTEIYTHVSIVKLKQIYAVTHPAKRAQKKQRADCLPIENERAALLDALESECEADDE